MVATDDAVRNQPNRLGYVGCGLAKIPERYPSQSFVKIIINTYECRVPRMINARPLCA
jgi:hypothetical protein